MVLLRHPLLTLALVFFAAVAVRGVAASAGKDTEKIKVIFAGFHRSGTKSLKLALLRLGFNPLHGTDLVSEPVEAAVNPLLHGKGDDLDAVEAIVEAAETLGYDAFLEVHSPWWREIHKLRPDAKIIVIIRDYEKWEASIERILQVFMPLYRQPLSRQRVVQRTVDFVKAQVRQTFRYCSEEDTTSVDEDEVWEYMTNPTSDSSRALRRQFYDRFVKDAHQLLHEKPEQAFLLDFKKGYGPLCEFLQVDPTQCPVDEPLPHVNKPWEVNVTLFLFVGMELVAYVVPALPVVGLIWWVARRRRSVASNGSSKEKQN